MIETLLTFHLDIVARLVQQLFINGDHLWALGGDMGGSSPGFHFGHVGLTLIVIPKSSLTHLKISKDTSKLLRLMQSEEREVWTCHAGRCLSEDVQSTCKRLRSENNGISINTDQIELGLW